MPIRLLLSHNYSIAETLAPPLSAGAFCALFAAQLPSDWVVKPVDHPHWRCEVKAEGNPAEIGDALVKALVNHRTQQLGQALPYGVLALGGLKNTPATSSNPNALQPGDWGVDVVETPDADAFLQTLGWDALIAGRPQQEIFKAVSA
ncbi:MAG: DUF2656 family protein [Cyanobacteria bacterium J06635_1]